MVVETLETELHDCRRDLVLPVGTERRSSRPRGLRWRRQIRHRDLSTFHRRMAATSLHSELCGGFGELVLPMGITRRRSDYWRLRRRPKNRYCGIPPLNRRVVPTAL